MRSRALRGAFIGFGHAAAQAHLPVWQSRDDVAIVAATDRAEARREAFLAACPGGRWHATLDQLLSEEALDFVDICTPPGSHAGLIQQALRAGLHVLCEKPLVTRESDARAIAAAAGAASRAVYTVHNWLEAPICRKISELIAKGAIGAVRKVDWRTLRTQPAAGLGAETANWRVDPAAAGGGILFDHGWHALYCVMRWLGGAPHGVEARLETRRHVEWPLHDTATLELDFGGRSGQIFLTWAADVRANHIDVEGERGCIRVDGGSVILEGQSAARRWFCPPPLAQGSYHPDWFAGSARDFCAVITGRAPGNLDEAMLCMQIIGLAQRSSDAGGARLALRDQAPEAAAARSRQARTSTRKKKIGAPNAASSRNQLTLPNSAKASTR
jgi:predicted dehydrogenase